MKNNFFHFYSGRAQAKLPKQMRSFDESFKSKKTVASMIERKGDKSSAPPKKMVKIVEANKEEYFDETSNGLSEDILMANRKKLAEKLLGKKKSADSK